VARQDAIFARVNVDILNDVRMRAMDSDARWFYMTCYLLAVKHKTEVLSEYHDVVALSDLAQLSPGKGVEALAKCVNKGLLVELDNGKIVVKGVQEWHQRLADFIQYDEKHQQTKRVDPYGDTTGTTHTHTGTRREEKRTEEESIEEKRERDTSKKSSQGSQASEDGTRHAVVLDWWNGLAAEHGLSKARMTKSRRTKIGERLKEGIVEALPELTKQIGASHFLTHGSGDNGNSWKINFTWLIHNDSNWVRVLEGNYSGEGGKAEYKANPELYANRRVTVVPKS